LARVFISYARANGSRAEEIRAWLRADGHEVFLDRSAEDGLQVGKEWKPQLYAALRDADAVVCVVSPAFLASTWCAAEIAVADARGCLVLPLRVASSDPHPVIESLQYADYEADPGGVRARVLAQLREIDGGGRASWEEGTTPTLGWRRSPKRPRRCSLAGAGRPERWPTRFERRPVGRPCWRLVARRGVESRRCWQRAWYHT
jgi:TIR domain